MPDTKNTLKKWEVEGPLTVREVGGDREYYYITGEIGGEASRTIASVGCWTDREGTKEDADLLASAPALVKRIKELEAENARLREAGELMIAWDDAETNAKPFTDDSGQAFYRRADLCREAFKALRAALKPAEQEYYGEFKDVSKMEREEIEDEIKYWETAEYAGPKTKERCMKRIIGLKGALSKSVIAEQEKR